MLLSATSKMVKTAANNLPWWVNAIYKVGVPTAIACYLVWILASKVQTEVEAVQNVVNQHVQDQQRNMLEFTKISKEQLKLLRAMCLHSAKTDNQRDDCVQ